MFQFVASPGQRPECDLQEKSIPSVLLFRALSSLCESQGNIHTQPLIIHRPATLRQLARWKYYQFTVLTLAKSTIKLWMPFDLCLFILIFLGLTAQWECYHCKKDLWFSWIFIKMMTFPCPYSYFCYNILLKNAQNKSFKIISKLVLSTHFWQFAQKKSF